MKKDDNIDNEPCPNCGYCPHCKRARPVAPLYPVHPADVAPQRPSTGWVSPFVYGDSLSTNATSLKINGRVYS